MSFLEQIANDGFAETVSTAFPELEEARVFKTRGRGGLIKRDNYKGYKGGVIRFRPDHKGLAAHSKSEHRSHGIGSFCRTHPFHKTCR